MTRRVCVVTTSYPTGRDDQAGHFVGSEARALASDGDAVTVLAPGTGRHADGNVTVRRLGGGHWSGSPGALVRLQRHPAQLRQVARFVYQTRSVLAREHFDTVIAHWLVPCGYPIASAARGEVELVAHGTDVRLLLALPRPLLTSIVQGWLARRWSIRFVSEELRRALLAAAPHELAPASRVEPCSIQLEGVPSCLDARTRLGVSPEDFLAVVIGRLTPGKRPAEAIARALSLHPARLVVIGAGPLLAPLRRRFPAAEFLGSQDRRQTLCWLASADLLVCASRTEGAPTVVREARALGVACWCAPSGDLADWARHDRGLVLFDDAPPQCSSSRGNRSTKLHGRVLLSS